MTIAHLDIVSKCNKVKSKAAISYKALDYIYQQTKVMELGLICHKGQN